MRYLPLQKKDRQRMLQDIGIESEKDLFAHLPKEARDKAIFNLPSHKSEWEVEKFMQELSTQNLTAANAPFFLGAGAYRHHIPASVDHIIQRGEFLTSYTPYQPEISQGTLQYLFEFQTQVAMLTGMEVANASLYDGATATVEAVLMATRITGRSKVLLSGHLHPQYIQVIKTYASMMNLTIEVLPPVLDSKGTEAIIERIDPSIACVVTQCPGFLGHVYDYIPIIKASHEHGALHIGVITEIIALGLLYPPGNNGADIVVAEGQSIGNSLNYGGPYLGLFATRDAYKRSMPGRLVGESIDVDDKRGFIMTLVAREQHIRRAKATSNICTNSGLCSLAFTMHMTLLGGTGLNKLAKLNHAKTCQLAQKFKNSKINIEILPQHYFNEFVIKLPFSAQQAVDTLLEKNILAGVPVSRLYPGQPNLENLLLVACTELTSEQDMNILVAALEGDF